MYIKCQEFTLRVSHHLLVNLAAKVKNTNSTGIQIHVKNDEYRNPSEPNKPTTPLEPHLEWNVEPPLDVKSVLFVFCRLIHIGHLETENLINSSTLYLESRQSRHKE